MKLLPATLARERPQRYPMAVSQPELPNIPPPMTFNRSRDFRENEDGHRARAYGDELHPFGDE